jgi:RNA polymerase sigma factor (sigma-70 family)
MILSGDRYCLSVLPTERSLFMRAEGVQKPDMATVEPESLATRSSLLNRLRNVGDDISWRAFFETYWRLIYNVARKSGLSDADAQDVVQETVICVARKMPDYRYDATKGSFKNWLRLITRRRIHDHLRKIYRALPTAGKGAESGEKAIEEIPSLDPTPDEQIDAAWEQEWRENVLQGALARIRQKANPRHYQVFESCVLRNLPPLEVARMFGLSIGQVYLIKHRTSLAVKRVVQDMESELGSKMP